jgi:hypothetical protein
MFKFSSFWLAVLYFSFVIFSLSFGSSSAIYSEHVRIYGVVYLYTLVGLNIYALYKLAITDKNLPRCLLESNYSVVLLCSLGFGALLISQYPNTHKVYMDEYVNLTTSYAIHLEREVSTPTILTREKGIPRLQGAYLDKRPYGYAWLVSLVHDLKGYNPRNAFIVNNLVGLAFCVILATMVYFMCDGKMASVALSLTSILALPIFGQQFSSAGIDAINILFILILLGAALVFFKKPQHDTFTVLLAVAVLTAYFRYESIIFILVPCYALFHVWTTKRIWLMRYLDCIILVCLTPVIFNLFLTIISPSDIFQALDVGKDSGFSLSYATTNFSNFFKFLFATDHLALNSLGLTTLFFLCGFFCIYQYVKNKINLWPHGLVVWFVILLIHFLLLISYSWGDAIQPVAYRLFLPSLLVIVIFSTFTLSIYSRKGMNSVCYAIIALMIFDTYYIGYRKINKDLYSGLTSGVQRFLVRDFILDRKHPEKVFVIDTWTPYWLANNVESLPLSPLIANKDYLNNLINSRHFEYVYLILDDESGGIAAKFAEFTNAFPSIESKLLSTKRYNTNTLVNFYELKPSS